MTATLTPNASTKVTRIDTLYRQAFPESAKRFERARQVFPNGVTHDTRYLEPFPVCIDHALGGKKYDLDGHEIVDYFVGHGALLLGHSHPAIVEAVQHQMARGTHFGSNHEVELEWGEWVKRLIRSAERVRFTSSGTEATLMAIRLARIFTGRNTVIKFAGHFHGWHDIVMPAADAPFGPDDLPVPGVTDNVMRDLVVLPPNDLAAVRQAIEQHRPACVILEATGGHWGLVPVQVEFLRELRKLTQETGVVLIFDEVITGFRVSPGGAQEHFNLEPDLTTLAKVLAGGLPGGAVAGRHEILELIEFGNRRAVKMRHPGTYNGNPLSAAAGAKALQLVATGEPTAHANALAAKLRRDLNEMFRATGVNWIAYGDFSMVNVLPEYDGPRPDSDSFVPYGGAFEQLDRKIDRDLSHAFRKALLLNGVDFFGWRAMTSWGHTEADINRTTDGIAKAITLLRADGFVP